MGEDPIDLTFDIFFPGEPQFFLIFLGIMIVLVVYWLVKFVVSVYTGAGGG